VYSLDEEGIQFIFLITGFDCVLVRAEEIHDFLPVYEDELALMGLQLWQLLPVSFDFLFERHFSSEDISTRRHAKGYHRAYFTLILGRLGVSF